jgi:UDP-3-O-[3-hydroxymyristoyl] glucosamine N-acyltransferase
VAANAVVETATNVGRGAIIDIGVVVDHECRIGAFCHLRPGEVYGPRSVIPSTL